MLLGNNITLLFSQSPRETSKPFKYVKKNENKNKLNGVYSFVEN